MQEKEIWLLPSLCSQYCSCPGGATQPWLALEGEGAGWMVGVQISQFDCPPQISRNKYCLFQMWQHLGVSLQDVSHTTEKIKVIWSFTEAFRCIHTQGTIKHALRMVRDVPQAITAEALGHTSGLSRNLREKTIFMSNVFFHPRLSIGSLCPSARRPKDSWTEALSLSCAMVSNSTYKENLKQHTRLHLNLIFGRNPPSFSTPTALLLPTRLYLNRTRQQLFPHHPPL